MGYTHYWKNGTIDEFTWESIRKDVEKLIKLCSVPVRFEYDVDEPAIVDDTMIRFNGVGYDGHETFLFKRTGLNQDFCKTARKPYDILVAATLAVIADKAFQVEVNSDGEPDEEEWVAALAFASECLGREIKYPCPEG